MYDDGVSFIGGGLHLGGEGGDGDEVGGVEVSGEEEAFGVI